jgi:hypothetical protein
VQGRKEGARKEGRKDGVRRKEREEGSIIVFSL